MRINKKIVRERDKFIINTYATWKTLVSLRLRKFVDSLETLDVRLGPRGIGRKKESDDEI